MSLNFNLAILDGRLTAAPKLETTPSGKYVASFTVAVNRPYSKNGTQTADFLNCVAWEGTAEFICRYFTKGSAIHIVGSNSSRSWTDKNGNKRYAQEIIVQSVDFVESKNQSSPNTSGGETPNYAGDSPVRFDPVGADEDLPF